MSAGRILPAALAAAALAACDPAAPPPPAPPMIAVAVGDHHSCALSEDGRAWCWGDGSAGQLGRGVAAPDSRPAEVAGTPPLVDIVAGGAHTCGLADDGSAYCWGDNARGQVGSGEGTGSVVPAPAPVAGGLRFASLRAGWEHTCGVADDGRAYCWGRGTEGQLGTGDREDRAAPAPVAAGASFDFIAPGGRHTCGGIAGAAHCWGANDVGQLGTGEAGTGTAEPVPVATSLAFVDIAAGYAHTCGRTAGSILHCWGENGYGELGDGTRHEPGQPGATAPVPIYFDQVTFAVVSAGRSYACAVRFQGEAMCWGQGSRGQLGHARLVDHATPALVVPAPGVRFTPNAGPYADIAASGSAHACGLTRSGVVHCWGSGAEGQLGYGEWLSTVPRPVRFDER